METIWAAVIGGAVAIAGGGFTAAWVLGRVIGGLKDAVERHRHVLENGLTAKVEDNRVAIARLLEHQVAQDECLREIKNAVGMITTRLEKLPCHGRAGCD